MSRLPITDDLIRGALAGLQFDFNLHRLGFFPKFSALVRVPGDRRKRFISRFVVKRSADSEAVFARTPHS